MSKKKTKEKNQVIEIHIYIHLEPVGAGSPTTTPQTIPYPPYPVYPSPFAPPYTVICEVTTKRRGE